MRGTRLGLQAACLSFLIGAAAPLCAHSLDVCNNGTVPVVVLKAMKNTDLARGIGKYYWAITSTVVPSRKCKTVYSDIDGDGAYLGFGFEDAKGQWGSGRVAQVPDLGKYTQYFQTWPVLSRGDGAIQACAPKTDTTYAVNDDPKTDCATMRLTPSGGAAEVRGPFFPITSSLYFATPNASCLGDFGAEGSCQYHLSISPNGTDRELHAAQGTGGAGADANPSATDGDSVGTAILKAMEKALAAESNNKPNPKPSSPTMTEDSHATLLKSVREDVADYIAASKTGFEAFKKGDAIVSPEYRSWESKVAPAIAKNCWVVQGTVSSTFSCLLGTTPDLTRLRALYIELTDDVNVSIPRDWTQEAAPPFGPDFPASKGYRATSGAHGELWIAHAASGEYELHFQLVTAENPHPAAAPDDDDPIGGGGIITPPTVRR